MFPTSNPSIIRCSRYILIVHVDRATSDALFACSHACIFAYSCIMPSLVMLTIFRTERAIALSLFILTFSDNAMKTMGK